MPSRKDANSSESSSRKFNSRDEYSEDEQSREENPKEQVGVDNDREKRRSRVTLRTGSPKPSGKLTLRAVRSKHPQTPPPIAKSPSRASKSPTRIGLSSKSSARMRPTNSSPERKPWGAPTIRVPPYHEESISKRKKITPGKSASEETRPTQPRPPPTRRYSLASLLDLRPPPIRRYAALSSSEDSGISMAHSDHFSLYARTNFHPATAQHRVHKILSSSREHSSSAYGSPHLTDSTNFVSGGSLHHNMSSTVNDVEPYHRSYLTPKDPSQALDAPTQNLGKYLKDDQAANVEDLESRIRSALSHRRRNFGSPRNLRSVRWDPAVLTTGPGTPGQPPTNETPDEEEDIYKRSEAPFREGRVRHSEISKDGGSVDRAAPSVVKDHKTPRKKQKKEFYQYMKSITELKKGDRKKLLQLLEALKNLDSDDSSDTDSEAQNPSRRSNNIKHAESKSKLDPKAPTFQDLPSVHVEAPIRPTSKVPAQRLVSPNENHNPNEPFWVKTSNSNVESRDSNPRRHKKDNEYQPQTDVSHISPSQKYKTSRKYGAHGLSDTSYLQRTPHLFPPLQFVPYTVPPIPLPPNEMHTVTSTMGAPIPRENTRVNPKLPIIDLATGRIPHDEGSGREAHVVPWGNFILENFQQKYPRTGIERAPAPASIRNTHAATIQQRLEYLLMEQKEKQARGEGLAERDGNYQGAKQERSFYLVEKELLKKLKAEIRRDEAERKLREPNPTMTQRKMRMVIPVNERISEDSTCVDYTIYTPEPMDDEGAEQSEETEGTDERFTN